MHPFGVINYDHNVFIEEAIGFNVARLQISVRTYSKEEENIEPQTGQQCDQIWRYFATWAKI